jgi:hypothetical protein
MDVLNQRSKAHIGQQRTPKAAATRPRAGIFEVDLRTRTWRREEGRDGKSISSKLEKSSESSWYHAEIATPADYNGNYLEKINVIIGVLHWEKIQAM